MYPVTLPDGRTLDLPTRWGKVTLGQFDRLVHLPEGSDVYNFLTVFLDMSPKEIQNLPEPLINQQVLPVLDFAINTLPSAEAESFELRPFLNLPGETAITARRLPTPKSLDIVTFGQATDLGTVLQDAVMPVTQKRQRVLAIVFYPAYVGGDYDSDEIEDFAEQVCSRATLEEALPITDFFLSSTTAFAADTPASSSAFPSPETRKPPASKPWWKSGMRWLWSTRWPVATKRSGPTSGASNGAR